MTLAGTGARGAAHRWLRRGRARTGRAPAFLWLPATLVGLAMALPLAYLALRAFGSGELASALLWRPRTLAIVLRSALLVVSVTALSTLIAVPLAWLTTRTDLPLRRFWSAVTPLPLVIPSYIAGFLYVLALGPKGLVQQLLAPLGVERLPDFYGFPGAALVLTLLCYPYVLLSARAALARLDPALEESARALGHAPRAAFFRVTLPLLRPAILTGALLVALYTLSDFGAVSLLRYETFTWAIYLQYGAAFNRAAAAALSLVLIAFTAGLLVLEARTRGRARYYRTAGGTGSPPPTVRLGRWRWPAFAFCSGVTALALALPMAVLSLWVVRGVAAGEVLDQLWGPTLNSLTAAGLAATAAVLAALPLAVWSVRYPSRWSALLERVSYVGFALPGVTVALALVFFGANFARPLYQTLALLVFAYVVLFLPTALGAMRASLLQVSPRLEEAARGLGKSPLQVLALVNLPLVRSGVLAGGALVFLLTLKELPATLILGPLGFKTLSTAIWSAASEAFFARAAAPALLLILVSSLSMAFILRGDGRGGR